MSGILISMAICIALIGGIGIFLLCVLFDTTNSLKEHRNAMIDAQNLNIELTDALDALNDYVDKIEVKLNNQARQIEGMNDVKKAKTITLTFPTNETREAFFEYMDSSNFIKEWTRVYSMDLKDNFDALIEVDQLGPKAITFTKPTDQPVIEQEG